MTYFVLYYHIFYHCAVIDETLTKKPYFQIGQRKKAPLPDRFIRQRGHAWSLLCALCFLFVTFKFIFSHDVDNTEIDVAHVEAGHVFDFAAHFALNLVKDERC